LKLAEGRMQALESFEVVEYRLDQLVDHFGGGLAGGGQNRLAADRGDRVIDTRIEPAGDRRRAVVVGLGEHGVDCLAWTGMIRAFTFVSACRPVGTVRL